MERKSSQRSAVAGSRSSCRICWVCSASTLVSSMGPERVISPGFSVCGVVFCASPPASSGKVPSDNVCCVGESTLRVVVLADGLGLGSSCVVAMLCCGAPLSLVLGEARPVSGSCWIREEHRDPSGKDSSSLVAAGVVAFLEFWLREPAMLPKRGGRGVRARSGDGGRKCRGLSWSVSLCGDSCCLGLGGMEVALSSCENSEAHEDLLLAVETSLGVGGRLPVFAESSSGSSGGAGDASSKVAKGGQSSAPARLAGVVRDADRVGPDSVSVVSAPEDADAELTEADAPRVSSLTSEDAALPLALESDSPSRRQERGPLAVMRGVIFGVRTCRREVVSPDLGEGAPDDWLSAAPPAPPGPPGQTKGAAPYRLPQRPPFLTKGLGQSPWFRAMVELHWSRPAEQGLSRTSTQGRGTLGLVVKAALGDHPPAKQATPELIAQYSGDSGVSLLPTAERHSLLPHPEVRPPSGFRRQELSRVQRPQTVLLERRGGQGWV
ncbi:hypothetical protein MRX96_018193 [Rhipicephalus microplus]